jgi:dimethylaniline monooxygenase (N-oxide forming)
MENKRVAIIGAGIAGLVSAKYCKENGLTPVIFDKNTSIGGVWSEEGSAWPNLETNISKYSCQFSDHFWKDEDPTFIPKQRMYSWLQEYIEKFGIKDSLRLKTTVFNIFREAGQFKIIYEKDGAVSEEIFPYLIVATGYFNKPNYIGLHKFESVSGMTIEHSCNYKDPRNYTGKKVIVVGFGHSSLQICEEVSNYAEKTYNIFRRPNIIVPKYFYSNDFKKFIFSDLVCLGNREILTMLNGAPQTELNKAINNYELSLSQANQNKIEALKIEQDCDMQIGLGSCQTYVDMVEKGKIEPIKAEIADITDEGVKLSNGQVIQADNLILATGFKSDLSFIDESILKDLQYDPVQDSLNLDGLNVFNTNVKGLAFVGF